LFSQGFWSFAITELVSVDETVTTTVTPSVTLAPSSTAPPPCYLLHEDEIAEGVACRNLTRKRDVLMEKLVAQAWNSVEVSPG